MAGKSIEDLFTESANKPATETTSTDNKNYIANSRGN